MVCWGVSIYVVVKDVVLFAKMGCQDDIEGGGRCHYWWCVGRLWGVVAVEEVYDSIGHYHPR